MMILPFRPFWLLTTELSGWLCKPMLSIISQRGPLCSAFGRLSKAVNQNRTITPEWNGVMEAPWAPWFSPARGVVVSVGKQLETKQHFKNICARQKILLWERLRSPVMQIASLLCDKVDKYILWCCCFLHSNILRVPLGCAALLEKKNHVTHSHAEGLRNLENLCRINWPTGQQIDS